MGGGSNENSSYLKDTELTLGLPRVTNKKRSYSEINNEVSTSTIEDCNNDNNNNNKVQAIGWPPIRSYRKNCLKMAKSTQGGSERMYVKVSMDGAPFLRKIDLKQSQDYEELLKALEEMFRFKVGSEYELTYEDKDGDWMLVGDVPWHMFVASCKRLRLMIKGSDLNPVALLN